MERDHVLGRRFGAELSRQVRDRNGVGRPAGDPLGTPVDSHGMSAALRADLAVTLAWGLKSNEDFHEEWANQFSDPHATSSYVDLFYNGALIHRELYVTVDGGRASLPLPERRGERLVAPIGYAHLCRLLVSFETNADDFDHYMTRAGISVVDEPWP